jgi:hypothetical protein
MQPSRSCQNFSNLNIFQNLKFKFKILWSLNVKFYVAFVFLSRIIDCPLPGVLCYAIRYRSSFSLSLWLYIPFVRPSSLFFFSFLILYTVELFGRGISPSQGSYLHTEQQKHRINANRYQCLGWHSNPRSQRSSGRRRFMP